MLYYKNNLARQFIIPVIIDNTWFRFVILRENGVIASYRGRCMNIQRSVLVLFLTTFCYCATAGSINQLPDANPGVAAKISRLSSKINTTEPDMGKEDRAGCNQSIGSLDMSKRNNSNLRENVTVIKGDAIIVCK